MNQGIIFVTVFLSSFSLSSASYGIQPATVDPRRPNNCYIKETNSYFEDGESWGIKGCGLATCVKIVNSPKNSQMMISYESCGSVGHDPSCYVKTQDDAEYPDCCPEIVCPESDEEQDDEQYGDSLPNEIASPSNQPNATKIYETRRQILKDLSAEELSDQRGNLQYLDSYDHFENEISDRKPSPRLFYMY